MLVMRATLSLVALVATLGISGTWSITPAATSGKIYLDLSLDATSGRAQSHSGSDYTPASIGLTQRQLAGPGHRVSFTIAREAGLFACDGWIAAARGGGSVVFTPNADFLSLLNARGYDVTADQQAAAAMLDVTIAYIDGIIASGIGHPSFENLLALRALGVDGAYVGGLRDAGTSITSAKQLIELSALKVDAAYVKALAAVGFAHLSPHQLVQLRALKIDAEYVRRVQAHGYPHPSVEDLVRLKSLNAI